MREARLMRNLKHPNIVRLWGVAVDEQPLYIVLELIKGGALNSFLQKNKCTMEEKMSMVLGAARGVDHLHKNGYGSTFALQMGPCQLFLAFLTTTLVSKCSS